VKGVERFVNFPYQRNLPAKPEIWTKGSVSLLDYRQAAEAHSDNKCEKQGEKPLLFVIPSLINRSFVLDLNQKHSFLRFAATYSNPILLDWGNPAWNSPSVGGASRGASNPQSLAEYITEYILPAFDYVCEYLRKPGQQVVVSGYCMGGIFALALAQLRPAEVGKIVFLATPWNFHSSDSSVPRLSSAAVDAMRYLLTSESVMPASAIQYLFYWASPFLFARKYGRVGKGALSDLDMETFVAIEEWANDGVDLPALIAAECIADWGMLNTVAAGKWFVDGTPISPENLSIPSMHVIPKRDRVVPPQCAKALADLMVNSQVLEPDCGHIGIMAGTHTIKDIWQPLQRWIMD
jgi:polyhydroxyalkanoate synthase